MGLPRLPRLPRLSRQLGQWLGAALSPPLWLLVLVLAALLVAIAMQQRVEGLRTKKSKKKKPKKKKKPVQEDTVTGDSGGGGSGGGGSGGGGSGGGGGKTTGISIFDDTQFADGQYSGKQDEENIVAVHEKHWKQYRGKRLRITYKGRSVTAVVADYCAVRDDSACNSNMRGGFLLDLHTNVAKKLGFDSNTGVDTATFQVV